MRDGGVCPHRDRADCVDVSARRGLARGKSPANFSVAGMHHLRRGGGHFPADDRLPSDRTDGRQGADPIRITLWSDVVGLGAGVDVQFMGWRRGARGDLSFGGWGCADGDDCDGHGKNLGHLRTVAAAGGADLWDAALREKVVAEIAA